MSEYRRALVTGASSGLGRELALWFATRGTTVYAAARRVEQLERLKAAAPEHLIPFPLDVSNAERCHDEVKALDASCGGLDLVVANAGVGDAVTGDAYDWAKVKRLLDVNVMGAVATLSGAIPGMVQRRQGHLVGISSVAAWIRSPKFGTYNASKTFLTAWLDNVRFDLEPHGLTVTSIHPGYVRTEMTAKNGAMPFVIDADDAARRMGNAIVRRKDRFSFPPPTALAVRFLNWLPEPVQRLLARRFT